MKKGKLTFAALVIALMLITIDVFFYLMVRPAFLVLTGTLAAYGYIRGGMDFRNWLIKGNEEVTPISLPEPVRHVRRNDEFGEIDPETKRYFEGYFRGDEEEDVSVDTIMAEYGTVQPNE